MDKNVRCAMVVVQVFRVYQWVSHNENTSLYDASENWTLKNGENLFVYVVQEPWESLTKLLTITWHVNKIKKDVLIKQIYWLFIPFN